MSDFPGVSFHKPVISCVAREARPLPNSTNYASGGLTANLAYYIPFNLHSPYLVRKLWWMNGSGTITGNADVGIYTEGGVLLTSTGATAQATVSIIQSVTLGTPYLLQPGSYYMAFSVSSGSATYWRGAIAANPQQLAARGLAQQSSAHPLPATATLATMSITLIPTFGIASALVI